MAAKTWWLFGVIALIAGAGALAAGRGLVVHIVPSSWTDEPERLAALLSVSPGDHVAEIGAGDGSLAVEMARIVGPGGRVFATELADNRRRQIASRVSRHGVSHMVVVEAAADRTNLPDACCHAVYMRKVLHHIDDPDGYARDLAGALRPGGRVAIIDFAPGGLLFLGSDHGITPDRVATAFEAAGFQPGVRIDEWGGGMFAAVFHVSGPPHTPHRAAGAIR
jgi:SAM-dependent methyltransferase